MTSLLRRPAQAVVDLVQVVVTTDVEKTVEVEVVVEKRDERERSKAVLKRSSPRLAPKKK